MWDSTFDETLRTFLPFLPAEEALTAETPLREYGLDSLATVELLALLEQNYNVRFEDDALNLETFENPGRLWATLTGLLPQSADQLDGRPLSAEQKQPAS